LIFSIVADNESIFLKYPVTDVDHDLYFPGNVVHVTWNFVLDSGLLPQLWDSTIPASSVSLHPRWHQSQPEKFDLLSTIPSPIWSMDVQRSKQTCTCNSWKIWRPALNEVACNCSHSTYLLMLVQHNWARTSSRGRTYLLFVVEHMAILSQYSCPNCRIFHVLNCR
jgi:hypothetical protein